MKEGTMQDGKVRTEEEGNGKIVKLGDTIVLALPRS